jgi:hypothetical protein
MTSRIGLPVSNNKNPILKKVIRVGDQPRMMLVALHESIVEQLAIDEQCWFEQIATSEEIILKISRCPESLTPQSKNGKKEN